MKNVAKILPALGDAGLGLITSAAMLQFFEAPYSLCFVVWILVWAYLPDLDGVIHFMRTGNMVADLKNGRDHREGLHYPLGWFTLFIVLFSIYGINTWLAGAFIAITLHFVHDMIGIGWGIQIFAPFGWGSYKLFSKKWISADVSLTPVVTIYSKNELRRALMEYGEADWIERYFCKWTHVSVVDYLLFAVGVISICYAWFQ